MTHRTLAAFLSLSLLGLSASALSAQFQDTEVSAPGSPPFLVGKEAWSWERLDQVSYTLYQSSTPTGQFEPLADGILNDAGGPTRTGWTLDASLLDPAPLLFFLVTANDGSADNRPGTGSSGDPRSVQLPPRCAGGGAPLQGDLPLQLTQIGNFNQPMGLVGAPGDPDRVYVFERPGFVQVENLRTGSRTQMLDISAEVVEGGERGLLGMDFHPGWPAVQLLYLHYSVSATNCSVGGGSDHCGVIASVEASGPTTVDLATLTRIMEIPQPFGNHNGGWIEFGPDGYLYIALGDGGAGGDPLDSGQSTDTLLGKLLRISVEPQDPNVGPEDCGALNGEYGVPLDNPRVEGPGGDCDEIWSWGLRNPWRNAFDADTGDLYIADVGQNQWEEVNVARASEGGGRDVNYGWNTWEASACFDPDPTCETAGFAFPAYEYDHSEGCSVTGGDVYRGCRMQTLAGTGTYFLGEFCAGWIRTFEVDGSGAAVNLREPFGDGAVGNLGSFGEDTEGELYVLSLSGPVYRFDPVLP